MYPIPLQTVSRWLLLRPQHLELAWRPPPPGWRSSSTTLSSTPGSPARGRNQTSFSAWSSKLNNLCLECDVTVQVDLPRHGQHGHPHPADHEPGPEVGQCRPSLAVPGGQQEQPAVRQVRDPLLLLQKIITFSDCLTSAGMVLKKRLETSTPAAMKYGEFKTNPTSTNLLPHPTFLKGSPSTLASPATWRSPEKLSM